MAYAGSEHARVAGPRVAPHPALVGLAPAPWSERKALAAHSSLVAGKCRRLQEDCCSGSGFLIYVRLRCHASAVGHRMLRSPTLNAGLSPLQSPWTEVPGLLRCLPAAGQLTACGGLQELPQAVSKAVIRAGVRAELAPEVEARVQEDGRELLHAQAGRQLSTDEGCILSQVQRCSQLSELTA